MVTSGYTTTLVAATLAISRSSLYCRKKASASRADRSYLRRTDRRGLRRKTRVRISSCGLVAAAKGKPAGESLTRTCDAQAWVVGAPAASARATKERVECVEASAPNQIWVIGHDQNLGWRLSHRCRTEDELAVDCPRSFGQIDADHRQPHAVYMGPVSPNVRSFLQGDLR